MKIFTIKTINQMGEYDEEWGATFWAHVHEQQMPVKFTKQITYTPAVGSKIVAEEHEVKQGTKGEFMSLRKVKVEESSQPTQTSISSSTENVPNDVMKILEIIDSKLDGILDKLDPPMENFDEQEQTDSN